MINPDRQNPVCSVCIANYNGRDTISDCLRSVINQTADGNIEIIVHDDFSTDNSVEIIKKQFPLVKLIISQTNVGFCISNNRMVREAKGRYLLLLNNDAALFPEAIEMMLKYADSHLDAGILSLPQYDWRTGKFLDQGCFLDFLATMVPNQNKSRSEVAGVLGACLWISKKLWLDIGGLPEWFTAFGDDIFLCCQARLRKYRVVALPESGYRHWGGKSFPGGRLNVKKQSSTSLKRRMLTEKNKLAVMLIHFPWWMIILCLPAQFLFLLAEICLICLQQKQIGHPVRFYTGVYTDAWKNKKNIFALRKKTLLQRKTGWIKFFSLFRLFPEKIKMVWRHGIPEVKI